MPSYHQLIVKGVLGADPELRYTSSGKAVCNFSIAVQVSKDADTYWHHVVCWEQRAEWAKDNLRKGCHAFCVGFPQLNRWEDKDGIKRERLQLVATVVQWEKPSAADVAQRERKANLPPESEGDASGSDDIPF